MNAIQSKERHPGLRNLVSHQAENNPSSNLNK